MGVISGEKMVLVEMTGGLGNQMFQYALYRKLLELNKDVYLDTSFFRSGQKLREFELERFALELRVMPDREIDRLRGYSYQSSFFKKLRFKLCSAKLSVYQDKIEYFQPAIFEMDDVYLQGYWQNEKYFADIRDTIKQELFFEPEMSIQKKKCLERMQNENSVSVHIRRGDYLDPQNQKVYGNICTADYYKDAVTYIREQISNPVFIVFSDDMDYAKTLINGDDVCYIDKDEKEDVYTDMYLMTQCRHHIIANSTFSWWGAWLTENEETITVCPERWFANHDQADVACDRWIRIKP